MSKHMKKRGRYYGSVQSWQGDALDRGENSAGKALKVHERTIRRRYGARGGGQHLGLGGAAK